MASRARPWIWILGTLVVLVVVVLLAIPFFLNTNSIRARIETTLTKSLGRKVTIRKVEVSLLSGGLLADNLAIADDPRFSAEPFVKAQSVKVHVALWPLITKQQVQVSGFVLNSPQITLIRGPHGKWNYSGIGKTSSSVAAHDQTSKQTLPNLTVGELQVKDGRVTLQLAADPPQQPQQVSRVYDKVDVDVKNFAFDKAFPFTASTSLPGSGTLSIKGTAGPVNHTDAADTPLTAHVEAKHIDPLAAGILDSSSGISGLVGSLTVDAAWTGTQLHVTSLVTDSPHITYLEISTPKQKQTAPAKQSRSTLQELTVDHAELTNGTVTITSPHQPGQPAVYQNLHATLNDLTATTASPFTLSAQLPGSGQLNASGKIGPYNAETSGDTPLQAQLTLKHVNLATSGFVPADAGIGGIADANGKVVSDGQTLRAEGQAQIQGIRLAKTGTPSQQPVDLQFALEQNEKASTGTIQHATITVAHAVVAISGTYQTSGPTTALNLKVNGQNMPVNDLEAFLPALGVKLPAGSRLEGGTLTANLGVSGSTANPIISGPVKLEDTQLSGFDLASKLKLVTQLTGASPSQVTQLKLLSMDLHDEGNTIQTNKLLLDLPALGTATGSGSVSGAGALDYHVILKPVLFGKSASGAATAAPTGGGGGGILGQVLGNLPAGVVPKNLTAGLKSGIPVQISGTTSNPVFEPNIRGLATSVGAGAAQGFLNKGQPGAKGAQGTTDNVKGLLGGFLGKH